jgi:2-polyprenyl-3-methyl-5-hydroxy-6-metoxy-1,4-benzoquinol methylase
MVDQLFPLVPGTLEQMESGANLLLADCGGGKALHRMALRFPQSRFVGIDVLPWNVSSAASHARAAGIGNLWFHQDSPDEIEVPPIYHVVVSLDPCSRSKYQPHWIVQIAGSVRPGGVLFFENDDGTARAALIAMGFRRVCESRPEGAPHRRFIVAVR